MFARIYLNRISDQDLLYGTLESTLEGLVSDLLPSIGGTLDVTSVLLVPLILCLGGSEQLEAKAMRALRILCKLHLHKRWSLAPSSTSRSKRSVSESSQDYQTNPPTLN